MPPPSAPHDPATTRQATATTWPEALPPGLRSAATTEPLLHEWCTSDASGELAERSTDDLAAAVASHLTAGLRRPPGRAVVRVVDGSVSGAGPLHTTVEVVADDMPFLVDSVTSALTRLGRGIHLVAHPRLAARRDEAGALFGLAPATSAECGSAGALGSSCALMPPEDSSPAWCSCPATATRLGSEPRW
jgi:glutamate dehydrogenase